MIKKWNKFNESLGKFTYGMSQEIIHYFSENSKPSKVIAEFLLSSPDTKEREFQLLFDFYDSGADEYKSSTKMLYERANSKPELMNHLIEVYNRIREERKDFPLISEIDDILVEFSDLGYSLRIDTRQEYYVIRVEKQYASLDDFRSFLNIVEDDIFRLQTDKISVVISKSSIDYISIWDSYYIDCKIIIYSGSECPNV